MAMDYGCCVSAPDCSHNDDYWPMTARTPLIYKKSEMPTMPYKPNCNPHIWGYTICRRCGVKKEGICKSQSTLVAN